MVQFELCNKCHKGMMIHSKLNIWYCSHCGFSYEIEPSSGKITILNKGKKL